GRVLSYEQLSVHAGSVGSTLANHLPNAAARRVGILASRSLPVYTGILGTLMAGCAVVPLNPGFPVERTRPMMELAEIGAIAVDRSEERRVGKEGGWRWWRSAYRQNS